MVHLLDEKDLMDELKYEDHQLLGDWHQHQHSHKQVKELYSLIEE